MRKDEFLEKLEMLLSDISQEEREEAMAFYRSYFDDAGVGNEARIIAELESPENVAETIKRDLGMVWHTDGNHRYSIWFFDNTDCNHFGNVCCSGCVRRTWNYDADRSFIRYRVYSGRFGVCRFRSLIICVCVVAFISMRRRIRKIPAMGM